MISVTDRLRYGRTVERETGLSEPRKPVVVWNCTRRCNLACKHCYSASTDVLASDELSTVEAARMIDDLAAFACPVLLFSGGEPAMREDLPELVHRAGQAGMRTALSTNGTLLNDALVSELAEAGLNYAGVSLDGMEQTNDAFRGVKGAFNDAMEGIRNCLAAGMKVGLRLTMNAQNVAEIPDIFDLIQAEGIPRVCFYHLVSSGRGAALGSQALSHQQTRDAVDLIMDQAAALVGSGRPTEVLTVDNHADGPYVYLRLAREDPDRADQCLELLQSSGGNSSGSGIGCVSWDGDVLPDQFWRSRVLGNIRRRQFSEIWADPGHPFLAKLRDRKSHLNCRCKRCRWLGVCNGNLRARAEAATRDPWGDDPACYLTDEEIS